MISIHYDFKCVWAVYEPAVALSTYLLLQLPFSPHQSTERKWPYDAPQEESEYAVAPSSVHFQITSARNTTLNKGSVVKHLM